MSAAKNSSFASSFPMALFLFCSPVALGKTSNTMLESGGETWNFYLFPYFKRKTFPFALLGVIFSDSFSDMTCIISEKFPSESNLLTVLVMKKCLFCHRVLYLLSQASFFILFMYYIALFDFYILNYPCTPGINCP